MYVIRQQPTFSLKPLILTAIISVTIVIGMMSSNGAYAAKTVIEENYSVTTTPKENVTQSKDVNNSVTIKNSNANKESVMSDVAKAKGQANISTKETVGKNGTQTSIETKEKLQIANEETGETVKYDSKTKSKVKTLKDGAVVIETQTKTKYELKNEDTGKKEKFKDKTTTITVIDPLGEGPVIPTGEEQQALSSTDALPTGETEQKSQDTDRIDLPVPDSSAFFSICDTARSGEVGRAIVVNRSGQIVVSKGTCN